MNGRKALVSLAIGRAFRERWRDICQANWRRYADRHGYDVICLRDSLDDSARARRRSPAWQKCLILSQPFCRDYERVVWIDLDILINPLAPDIGAGVPLDKVGAVDEYGIPTTEIHRQMLAKNYARWRQQGVPFIPNPTPQEYYTIYGFARGFGQVVQTGVLVLSPLHHRELLEAVYHGYEDKGAGWNYEMRPLSHELMQAGCVHWLDPRFNYIWGIYQSLHFPFLTGAANSPRLPACLHEARRETYFLHFAGSTELMATAATHDPVEPPRSGATAPFGAQAHSAPASADWTLKTTAVAFFIFNRPHTTAAVLEAIRSVRPASLLVIADGPRPQHARDQADCAAARAIIDQVDWPCDVRTHFADVHLGLKRRFETGMEWIFSQREEAILLEDDCVPEISFFRFCEELLARYRDDEQILSISGNNFQFGKRRGNASYYFSRNCHIWGWATWRRAWSLYDPDMSQWPAARDEGWLESVLETTHARQYWSYIFESNYRTQENWDYAWHFSHWRRGGVHVLPNVNLVSNCGFGTDATHTRDTNSKFAFMLTEPMDFPLIHPDTVAIDTEADAFTEEIMYSGSLRQVFERVRTALQSRRQARGA